METVNKLRELSASIKELASTINEVGLNKTASETATVLDSTQVLNFLKFFATGK